MKHFNPQNITELENFNILMLIFKYSNKNIGFPGKIKIKTSKLHIITESKGVRQSLSYDSKNTSN